MTSEGIEIIYDEEHWRLLEELRTIATKVTVGLAERNIVAGTHGSVARGDVKPESDVDVIILNPVSSHQVEMALILAGFQFYARKIAQATPSHAPKAHIYLDPQERVCVTFPMVPLRTLELDFYRFGGYLTLHNLEKNERIPGCDKRLMLIYPTPRGHLESSVRRREVEVAKILGVSLEIVQERVRVLTRRRKIGRTGVVVSIDVKEGEVFEDVLRRLARSNPVVSRRLR